MAHMPYRYCNVVLMHDSIKDNLFMSWPMQYYEYIALHYFVYFQLFLVLFSTVISGCRAFFQDL